MADKKISQLTTLAQADVAVTADFLPIVDTSATETKKATPQALVQAGATGATLPVALGAVTTPSYTFTGDLNTGLWSPGADTLAASTGGSERLRVDSSGNLGIGTASPGRKLHVASAGANYIASNNTSGSTSALLLGAESGQTAVYSWTTVSGSTGVPLLFFTGASEVGRFDTNGNLGLRTQSFGASSVGVIGIGNATTVPTSNPTGGGVLYVEAGALKYRGSSGTVTTIANA